MKKGINKKALILPLLILTILAVNLVMVSAPEGDSEESLFDKSIDTTTIYGKLFGVLGFDENWGVAIIGLIVIAIIFAGIYDILELVSIFQNPWVKMVIAIGLSIAVIIFRVPVKIASFFIQLGAGLGAIAIGIEIAIAMAIFIGLVFGNTWIAKFAAKRKGQVEEIKAIQGANRAGAAITGLQTLNEKFKEKP